MKLEPSSHRQKILPIGQLAAKQAWYRKRSLRIAYAVVLLAAVYVAVLAVGSLWTGYLTTRSDAHMAVTLARLGPGTPLEDYRKEFGLPMQHFTDPNAMASWGPSQDGALLSHTELYYFGYWGTPHRFIAVYVDKITQRSVLATWKPM